MLSVATFAKMVDVLGLKFWGISRKKIALSHGNGRPERGQFRLIVSGLTTPDLITGWWFQT